MPRRSASRGRPGEFPDAPADSLYGTSLAGLRFDALPVRYDTGRWITEFLGTPGPPEPLATTATTTASPTVPGFGSIDQSARGQIRP